MVSSETDRIWDFKGVLLNKKLTWMHHSFFVLCIGLVAKTDTCVAAYYLDSFLHEFFQHHLKGSQTISFPRKVNPDLEVSREPLTANYALQLKTRKSRFNLLAIKSTGKCDNVKMDIFLQLAEAQSNLILDIERRTLPSPEEVVKAISRMCFLARFRDLAVMLYPNLSMKDQFNLLAEDTKGLEEIHRLGFDVNRFASKPSWGGMPLYLAVEKSFHKSGELQHTILRNARCQTALELCHGRSVRNKPTLPEFLTKILYGSFFRSEIKDVHSTPQDCLTQLRTMISGKQHYFKMQLSIVTTVTQETLIHYAFTLHSCIHLLNVQRIIDEIDLSDPNSIEHIGSLLQAFEEAFKFDVITFFDSAFFQNSGLSINGTEAPSTTVGLDAWFKKIDAFEEVLKEVFIRNIVMSSSLMDTLYLFHYAAVLADYAIAKHEKSYKPDAFIILRQSSRVHVLNDTDQWAVFMRLQPRTLTMEDIIFRFDALEMFRMGTPLPKILKEDREICLALSQRYGLSCQCGGHVANDKPDNDISYTSDEDDDEKEDSDSSEALRLGVIEILPVEPVFSKAEPPKIPESRPTIETPKSIQIEFDMTEAAAPALATMRVVDQTKKKILEDLVGKKEAKTPIQVHKDSNVSEPITKAKTSTHPETSGSTASEDSLLGSEIEVVETTFLNSLLHKHDMQLLEVYDVRDILFAYLTIGNCVYVRHISPLLNYLKGWGFDFSDTFLCSPGKFFKEFSQFYDVETNFTTEAMLSANIPDLQFLENCLNFYKRRLMVAHPFFTKLPCVMKPMFKKFMSLLMHSSFAPHPSGPALLDTVHWRGLGSLGELGILEPISAERIRPEAYPNQKQIEYMLAVLALHQIGSSESHYKVCNFIATFAWNEVRNEMAHLPYVPGYLQGAKTIFKDTEHVKFLNRI